MKLILRPNWTVGGEMFGNTTNGVIDISPNGDIDVPDTLRICNTDLKKGKYSINRNKLIDICEEDIFQKSIILIQIDIYLVNAKMYNT